MPSSGLEPYMVSFRLNNPARSTLLSLLYNEEKWLQKGKNISSKPGMVTPIVPVSQEAEAGGSLDFEPACIKNKTAFSRPQVSGRAGNRFLECPKAKVQSPPTTPHGFARNLWRLGLQRPKR
jgi:hypothetical protein